MKNTFLKAVHLPSVVFYKNRSQGAQNDIRKYTPCFSGGARKVLHHDFDISNQKTGHSPVFIFKILFFQHKLLYIPAEKGGYFAGDKLQFLVKSAGSGAFFILPGVGV